MLFSQEYSSDNHERKLSVHSSRQQRVVRFGGFLSLFVLVALTAPKISSAAGSWWAPSSNSTWQWQLSTPVDQTVDAQVYDIDLFENSAAVVSSLHAQGRHVVCSLDAGTWEGWRSDVSKFPESVLGSADPGWTNERWLDIRQLSVLKPIMQARMEMCKQKGFDGVEVDNVDCYTNNTGFPLTAANQLTYNEWLATEAHALGLSIALKNDTGQIAQLQPYFDFALDEECFKFSECNLLTPFVAAGKAVFEVEYSLEPSQFCSQASIRGFMAMKKNLSLDSWNSPCWSQGGWVGAKGAAGYDLAGWDGSSDVGYIPNATLTSSRAVATSGHPKPPTLGRWKVLLVHCDVRPPTMTPLKSSSRFISAADIRATCVCMRWIGTSELGVRRSP
ncbi:MAG: endo alpha-1,4 polygalactosaminidase [Solirubrobacteraceae bacterium]